MQGKGHRGRAGMRVLLGAMCLACLVFSPLESRGEEPSGGQSEGSAGGQSEEPSGGQGAFTIEYDDLRGLLIAGNITLKQSYEDYEENVAACQEMWDIMKWEQDNMEDKAEESGKSGDENAGLYSSNAASLKSSASRIYSRLDSLTSTKSMKSLEKSADSTLLTAQTLMNSYQQMARTIEARRKSVEALTAVYNETARKQTIGSATGTDVLSAQGQMEQAVHSLETLREQASRLKRQFLTLIGQGEDSNVIIGAIPEPDLTAIDSIEFEADKDKAVNNNSNVISTRHSPASGTAAFNRRAKEVAEAEGTAESGITAAYEDLIAKRIEYQASLSSYDSALITYQSLQLKKQAGLLGNADYLLGEAGYLESRVAKEIASMNLLQAYEGYCWEVKGVAG